MDRTVLITGASGGIGGALAELFAGGGDRVALGCHAHAERAHALCARLRGQGASAVVCEADVADETQVERMFTLVERSLGPVEVLVNNAGISQQKLFTDITAAEWERIMAVHVTGAFLCCRRALPPMIRAKSGCIVNIASMWGQVGASCEVHYSAAKAAVIGLTRALAKEVAPSGVRVNCVSPGAVAGGMMDGFSRDDVQSLCEGIPMGRLGTAREIAAAALFLAGDGAGYITGQVLAPNGGAVV